MIQTSLSKGLNTCIERTMKVMCRGLYTSQLVNRKGDIRRCACFSEAGMIRDDTTVRPHEASAEDLMVVHPKSYLDSLKVCSLSMHRGQISRPQP